MYKWDHKSRPKQITVRWEDHWDNAEWEEVEDEYKPHIIETKGFLVYEDKKMICVARDYAIKPMDGTIGAVGKILKSCITYRSDHAK